MNLSKPDSINKVDVTASTLLVTKAFVLFSKLYIYFSTY
jgi:hypothetical protein